MNCYLMAGLDNLGVYHFQDDTVLANAVDEANFCHLSCHPILALVFSASSSPYNGCCCGYLVVMVVILIL